MVSSRHNTWFSKTSLDIKGFQKLNYTYVSKIYGTTDFVQDFELSQK